MTTPSSGSNRKAARPAPPRRRTPAGADSWLPFPIPPSIARPPLTSTQKQVLDFIRAYRAEHAVSPTLQEIGNHFKTHRVTVHAHVNGLIQKGYLVRFSRKASRSLLLADELEEAAGLAGEAGDAGAADGAGSSGGSRGAAGAGARAGERGADADSGEDGADPESTGGLLLPLGGRIAAGQPIEAVYENESLDVAALFPKERDLFVLEVTGDSMIDEQIRSGDYVVVERRSSASNGDIVVAILPSEYGSPGEATLKRFYREGSRIRLQPANASMQPLYFDRSANLEVRGVVVGVIRRYR